MHPQSLDEVCLWLSECEYWASGEGDSNLWLAEVDGFEHTRRGDCKAHAWWAWKQLAQLGFKVRLVRGRASTGRGHAWVTFRDGEGREYLLEATEKQLDRMIRPLTDAQADYEPHAAVDEHLTLSNYAAFYRELYQRSWAQLIPA
jgi:hypothetical protein